MEEEKSVNNESFENSMSELEKIANELEKNDLSLDESIKKFEEGMKLSKKCKDELDNAEKKITILIGNDEENFSPLKEEM